MFKIKEMKCIRVGDLLKKQLQRVLGKYKNISKSNYKQVLNFKAT